MVWVKFHEELTRGAKRGLPRALRFVLLEISLLARPLRGQIELPAGMSDRDAVADLLGGNRREVMAALDVFTEGPDPTILFEDRNGRRYLCVPSWSKWNAGSVETPGASTDRSRRFRDTQRSATAVASAIQRSATDSRSEKRRSETEDLSGGVDQGPGTNAREEPPPKSPPAAARESTKSIQGFAEDPANPTVAKILAALIAAGRPFKPVATIQFAEFLAQRSCADGYMGSLWPEDIAYGIAQAAEKEQARLAGSDEFPRNGGELRKYVAGFVKHIRRGEARRATESAEEAPDDRAIAIVRLFAAKWGAEHKRVYAPVGGDQRAASSLLQWADEQARSMPWTNAEKLIECVIGQFMSDPDPWLEQNGRGLRLLPARIVTYDLPSRPRTPRDNGPREPIQERPRLVRATPQSLRLNDPPKAVMA